MIPIDRPHYLVEVWLSATWRAMRTNMMKALRFAEFGPSSVLRIECAAIPEPSERESSRRRGGLGQCPESRYRPGWISRGICSCPGGDAVAQTAFVDHGAV